jgi:phosphoribosyl 1,2-cyclic phosphate phosphodiesterase
LKLKFLGSSDSAGIPVHNCECLICNKYRANNMENLSTSAYIEINNKVILLDAGVESISNIFDGKKIESIFLTHFHADHCMGLLRLRHSKDKINCFHPKDEEGFSDLFKHNHSISYNQLESFQTVLIEEIKFTAIPLKHSKNCNGYLIEYMNTTITYLTDCSGISKESMNLLKSKEIDYCFIDACYDERKTKGNHLNYLQASEILDELEVKNGFLMHISHTTQEYIEKNNINLKYKYLKNSQEFNFN